GILTATFISGEWAQRIHHRHLAKVAAVVGFQTPESYQIAGRYTVILGDAGKTRAVPGERCASLRNALISDPTIQVVSKGGGELRLLAIQLNYAGIVIGFKQALRNCGVGNSFYLGAFTEAGQAKRKFFV